LRPKTIVSFEILSLAAVALGLLVTWLTWDGIVAQAQTAVLGSGIEAAVAILVLVYVAILVLLILLASRRASNVARWLLALIVVLELVFTLPGIGATLAAGTTGLLSTLQLAMMTVAVVLLFLPASRLWFRGAEA
jgi:hypothetical protein